MDWRDPEDWSGMPRPSQFGTRVRLLCDFGVGDVEVAGRAWNVRQSDGSDVVVYSDIGGWCTDYVKGWKPFDGLRDEIDEDQDSEEC